MAEIVRNSRATFLTTSPCGKRSGKDGRDYQYPALRLQPGVNNVPDGMTAALDGLPSGSGPGKVWNQWRALGWVTTETVASKAKVEGPDAPVTLADRKPEAAEAMVAVESSPEVLRRWLASDKRKPIQDAIQARLRVLSGGAGAPAE